MPNDWKANALLATQGTQLGAILRCAMGVERDSLPRFEGRASVTSDGFVMSTFVTRDGDRKHSAFVGSHDDLRRNVKGLALHLSLSNADKAELEWLIAQWIVADYRTPRSASSCAK